MVRAAQFRIIFLKLMLKPCSLSHHCVYMYICMYVKIYIEFGFDFEIILFYPLPKLHPSSHSDSYTQTLHLFMCRFLWVSSVGLCNVRWCNRLSDLR